MLTIMKKELEDYKKVCYNEKHGRLLAIDGMQLICNGFNRGLEVMGQYFLETLAGIQSADKP